MLKNNLISDLRNSLNTFRNAVKNCVKDGRQPIAGWLVDNYYFLEKTAKNLIRDSGKIYRKYKGSDLIPGLFIKCREVCAQGVLPSQDELTVIFRNIDFEQAYLLPFILSSSLISVAAQGVRMNNAAGVKMLSNSISSLRRFDELDFEYITRKTVVCEELLLRDPSGVYGICDDATKNEYRKSIVKISKKSGKTQLKIAGEALLNAQKNNEDIGRYLLSTKKNVRAGVACLVFQYFMPLCVAVSLAFFLSDFRVGLLLYFPLCIIFRNPVERAFLSAVTPKRFLRLRNDCEEVENVCALLTVSTLLPSADGMKKLGKHLEKLYLSNGGNNIRVCCLADFKAADMPSKPEDKVILKAAAEMIDKLNSVYGGGFILAVRPRTYSKTQSVFIGRERKRGAITDLINAIKGDEKGFAVIHGDKSDLKKNKYIIALDSDTELEFDGARELISVAEHPINRPTISKEKGRVTAGYGILVPRAATKIGSKTRFSDIMSDEAGVSSYEMLANEKYQDLFSEAVFCGKGLIDVEAYHSLLTSGFPKETVLSHDIIESGYLRSGYVSDVCITESFPKNTGSYFSRLHRWVRGDWQNIRFIFGKNPLNLLSRYKLADNLLRSLSLVFLLCTLISSLFFGESTGALLACVALFSVMSSDFFSGVGALVSGGFSAVTRKFYSGVLPESIRFFARGAVKSALWVKESLVCLSAAVTALWRLFVSKKNLLEWTPAANSEKSDSILQLLLSCAPSVAVAVLLFIYGESPQRLAALFILADVPITLMSGAEEKQRSSKPDKKSMQKLMDYAAAMWRFFDENCTEKHNYLVPDNVQLSPSGKVAARTSPTNIGLMLTSFLAARDLGFIGSDELCERLAKSLKTVDMLEKYRGNLLNWYSTETCGCIGERFVSTVDSGNFLCCLVALKEGIKEYIPECSSLIEIVGKIEKIIEETDLSVLYNKRKKLFYIGIFADDNRPTENCYDLYMSEARMTSYFAVAKRIVPKNHWGTPGRMLVSNSGFCGLASWTGTMFEYFMPNLFIPAEKGTLDYETLRFCLKCQRKKAGSRPFGVSESGFYAFDGELNYQYKAHGIRELGLKRGLDREYVVSPYSSFLTLATAPKASAKNLERLEGIGLAGQYGFYEAADYTKGRCSGKEFSIVRSFMAHHIGMSMVSTVNALKNNAMQKRFMRDKAMLGAESLLREKIPKGAPVFKDIYDKKIVTVREKTDKKSRISENPCVFSPKATLFSNGMLTNVISDVGTSLTLLDGYCVTVPETDIIARPQGVFAVFEDSDGVKPFVSVLDKEGTGKYRAEFGRNSATHEAKHGFLSLKMQTTVNEHGNCEHRKFTVAYTGKTSGAKGKLIVYFEPCLDKKQSYSAHPAFSKLFVTDEWDDENKIAVFTRRTASENENYTVAAGFVNCEEVKHGFSREKVLQTPLGVISLGSKTDFNGERGNPDCCAAFSVDIDIKAGENVEFEFILAAEKGKEQAINTFVAEKNRKKPLKSAISIFGTDALDSAIAEKIIPAVIYNRCRAYILNSDSDFISRKEHLWSFGVSGDNPIITVKAESLSDAAEVSPYIRVNKNLRSCGIQSDLVLMYDGDEGYRSEIRDELRKRISLEGCELMAGVNGGIHIVNLRNHSAEQVKYLELSAAVSFGLNKSSENTSNLRYKPLKTVECGTGLKDENYSAIVKQYNFTKGKITVDKKPETLDIPWNLVLSNKNFGTMVSDKSLGFTWAINSRENKLSPWYNDTMSDNRGERLIMKYNGVLYDLISLSKAVFTPEKAIWNLECASVEFRITAEVADRGLVKKCTVEIMNKSDSPKEFDVLYHLLPVNGVSREKIRSITVKRFENGVVYRSLGGEMSGATALQCDGKADFICLSEKSFREGKFNELSYSDDCCVAVGRRISLATGGKTSFSFCLSWGATEKAAVKMPYVSKYSHNKAPQIDFSVKNKNIDLFFNSFLYNQIKNCRFYGRTAFYQCSGAYGFRDQLQDCLALVYNEPWLVRTHLLRCAAVQFIQGDVMHWWHVTVDKVQKRSGVRTRCSDDMLWLPFVCADYVKKTGDSSILGVEVPYIESETLGKNENERYVRAKISDFRENLYRHCVKAIEKSLNFGKNGLPLIGSCDWNDGLSAVGDSESGESVWLAMFQIRVLKDFIPLCEMMNERDTARKYSETARILENIVESEAWLGDHYARAFKKDGSILGGEDFVDILPQAFSVFAGFRNQNHIETALTTAYDTLFDEEKGIIRLFNKPFVLDDAESVGYIAKYPAGIRENSGQYTHAAVWLACAMLKSGKRKEGEKLLNAIIPLSYYAEKNRAETYRAEPYVLAADVSCADGAVGRAGWTYFTGSASWLYRCILEDYLRYKMKNGVLMNDDEIYPM